MTEVQVWILSGVLSFALAIFLILFRNWTSKQDGLIEAINELRLTIVKQSEQLKILFNMNNDTKAEIKELDRRINKIEQKIN